MSTKKLVEKEKARKKYESREKARSGGVRENWESREAGIPKGRGRGLRGRRKSGQDFNILGHAALPGGHAGYGKAI